MAYIKADSNRNNTVIEVSESPYSGTTKDGTPFNYLGDGEFQVEINFSFPTSQALYNYRVNDQNEIEGNDAETVAGFLSGPHFRIYDYMNVKDLHEFHAPPVDFDYNILGLSKKRTFTKGELDKIEYYGSVDSGGTYQDLILTEYREFYRKDRMVYMRKMTIDWYLEDGSTGATKTTLKFYTPEESLKLGERRRRNVISDMKISSIGLLQAISGLTSIDATMKGMEFLALVTNEITQYIEGIEEPLMTKVMTCSEAGCEWLDNVIPNTGGITVRQYLYSNIDIDYSDKIYTS